MKIKSKQQLQLDIPRLLADHGVAFEESNNGWINTKCPFCHDSGQHLGWSGTVFSCFKCGKHGRIETLSSLLSIEPSKIASLTHKYEGRIISHLGHYNLIQTNPDRILSLKLPYGTSKMKVSHKKYLLNRGFDTSYLETEWDLLGTSALGEFKYRIIVPIHQEKKLVCYQGRDITTKASAKYKSCHDEDAVIPIKSCLYGIDKCKDEWIIITEGVTNVWRLRINTVATFGVVVTDEQLLRLSKFQRRYIFFDSDEAGKDGAEKLAQKLSVFPGVTEICSMPGISDIADMRQKDADEMVKHVRA